MKNTINSENLILTILILLILASYFIGYAYSENSAGGGEADFEFVWRNLQTFTSYNLFDAIKLTAIPNDEVFQSTRTPGFYVLNKLFNPFTGDKGNFQTSIFLISLIIPIIFYLSLKIKFENEKKIYLAFLSSIILLSPYFRTSAIWGLEENFGIFSTVLTAFFFIRYNNKKYIFNEKLTLNFLAISSSLCVYFDQKLILIPLICFFSIFFSKKNLEIKFFLTINYILLSLPFIYLMSIWGNIAPSSDASGRGIFKNFNFHHIGYVLTIISFYLLPLLLFIKKSHFKVKKYIQKKNIFIFLLFLIYLIYFLMFHQLENEYHLGGGAIKRLIQLVTQDLEFQKILFIFAFIGSFIVFIIVKDEDNMNNFILLFLISTSILITPALFQEYFDPLMLILVFLFLRKKLFFDFKKLIILFSYFFIFLVSANFYY